MPASPGATVLEWLAFGTAGNIRFTRDRPQAMNLGSIILFVKDMKTVSAFYRDVVGLQPAEEQPFAEQRFLRFDTGSCQLCLHSAASPNGGRQKIGFHVDSVRAVHEALKSRGLRLRRLQNEDGKACFDISDPEGNRIQFWGDY